MMPGDPVVGGSVLRRPAIASPDYVPGQSGWSINADGSAQFNNLSIIIQPGAAGGFVLTVVNASGAVLANIDTSGNITGQTVNAITDVVIAGISQLATNASLAAAITTLNTEQAANNVQFAAINTAITQVNTALTALSQPPATVPPAPPGAPTPTYTELFYPASTWTYVAGSASGNGLQGTNVSMKQGGAGGSGAYNYSYIQWAAGSLGNNLNTVLNRTVLSVTLRLYCQSSYFSNGMRFGLHSSTSLGGAQGIYSVLLNNPAPANPTGNFIGKGAMTTYTLTAGEWNPFKAGGVVTYLVLSPDAADLTNPSWNGYFYGGGGADQYMPLMTVTYQ